MKILNETLSASSKTYATYDNAVKAAGDFVFPLEHKHDEFFMVIATFGKRFAPMFILSEKQVVLSACLANAGFMVVRRA